MEGVEERKRRESGIGGGAENSERLQTAHPRQRKAARAMDASLVRSEQDILEEEEERERERREGLERDEEIESGYTSEDKIKDKIAYFTSISTPTKGLRI